MQIRGTHRAQVTDVHPDTGKVSVVLENIARAEGIRVEVTGERQHPVAGKFHLPEIGDWGLVTFTHDDTRSGYWHTSIKDRGRNLYPAELLSADPHAELDHAPSDYYTVRHGDGSTESVWPDGSFLKLTTAKDGGKGNPSLIGKLTQRFRTLSSGMGQAVRRELFQGQRRAPVDVLFRHSSGAAVQISADGRFHFHTPGGHAFTLDDAEEQTRDPNDPLTVTGTPGRGQGKGIALSSSSGHTFTLDDERHRIQARTAGGLFVTLDDNERTATVHGEIVVVDAGMVKLGSAGASRRVVLDGDTGIDPDGTNVTVKSSAAKVYAE